MGTVAVDPLCVDVCGRVCVGRGVVMGQSVVAVVAALASSTPVLTEAA